MNAKEKKQLIQKIDSMVFFQIPEQIIAPGEHPEIYACCAHGGKIHKTKMQFAINKDEWLINNLADLIKNSEPVKEKPKRKPQKKIVKGLQKVSRRKI